VIDRRRTPLHRALHRPTLIAGGERELVLMTGLVAFGLVASAMNWVAAVVGFLLYGANLYLLRLMAKADPEMSKVYLRQLKYSGYYAPRSRHWRQE